MQESLNHQVWITQGLRVKDGRSWGFLQLKNSLQATAYILGLCDYVFWQNFEIWGGLGDKL